MLKNIDDVIADTNANLINIFKKHQIAIDQIWIVNESITILMGFYKYYHRKRKHIRLISKYLKKYFNIIKISTLNIEEKNNITSYLTNNIDYIASTIIPNYKLEDCIDFFSKEIIENCSSQKYHKFSILGLDIATIITFAITSTIELK